MNIIGIAGRRDDGSSAGSGKDEVAKILAKNHGFAVVSFADEIKRTAMRWYDIDPKFLWGPSGLRETYLEKYGCTVRHLLQQLGTEVGRNLYKDTWVDYALKIAKTLIEDREYDWEYRPEEGLIKVGHNVTDEPRYQGVVIPDVRWPAGNEGEVIKAAGGTLWLVVRPGTAQTGTATAKHASETQPVPDEAFDVIIKNDGTLADLEHKVQTAISIEGAYAAG